MLGHYLANLARHGRIDPVEYYPCSAHRVVYVENAKVACSAIKQALYPDVSYEALGQERFHEALRARASLRPPAGTADYLYFSVFRDPVARLHSCYTDKICGAAAHNQPGIFHTRFHRILFRLFAGEDIARPGLSFDDFACAVARVPDRLRDRHAMSQTPIREAVTAAPRHFVGRIEQLTEDWAALSALTGLPELPRLNSSAAPEGARPDSSGLLFSSHAREALARAYAADFCQLSYPLPENGA